MSIDYFGVNTADPSRISELVENRTPPADIAPIDVDHIRARIIERSRLRGAPGQPLTYSRNDSHMSVYVSAASVQLNHNTAGDFDDIMDEVMEVQAVMTDAGLNVWDPQEGSWFPGSPALENA